MRISREREELAKMKYAQVVGEIGRKHEEQSRRIQYMPRGGAQRGAADKAHIGKLTELADAWIDIYLEAFTKDAIAPDANDLKEMEDRIDQMFAGRYGSDLYTPMPSSVEEIRMIPDRAKFKLRTRVKEMQLESRNPPAQARTTNINTINVHGDNYGQFQQGGADNIQSTNRTDDETK